MCVAQVFRTDRNSSTRKHELAYKIVGVWPNITLHSHTFSVQCTDPNIGTVSRVFSIFSAGFTMSDLRHFSKAFMADFIQLYKSYPCLWKTKSSDYKDRNKKDTAYTVLLKKLQEIEPNATKKTVTAKINSIRGSFRREMKKIEDSKRSGSGADEIYATHLWYYDLLLFTKDQEMPRESVSNLVENGEGESGSEQGTDDGGEVREVQLTVIIIPFIT